MNRINPTADFLPIPLKKNSAEKNGVSIKGYDQAFFKGIEGMNVLIKLTNANGKHMADFMAVENEKPFFIIGYGIINIKYDEIKTDKTIVLHYI